MRRVLILGSTGSIGTQAIDIVRAHPELFTVVGLSAGRNADLLATQARELGLGEGQIALGAEGALGLIRSVQADVVLNAITGSVGLMPTIEALKSGAVLALANKESLIVGGKLVTELAAPGQIVPVDSEHSALAQALMAGESQEVARLIVTASGGPFRGRTREQLLSVTPQDALAHPTWNMGRVVTTNSATLVNKGLEVIEAHLLFDIDFDRIDVTVHPQSIVHSLVEFVDGSTIAQCSPPDMRLPIGYALAHPERIATPFGRIDWAHLSRLDFAEPDTATFRGLSLAYAAGRLGGTAPAFMSAANEVAVEAFLAGRIRWIDIVATVEVALDDHDERGVKVDDMTVDHVIDADRRGREAADRVLARVTA